MLRKILTLSLVAVMFSVTAFAGTDIAFLTQVDAATGEIAQVECSSSLTVGGNGLSGSATLSITSCVDKTAIVLTAVRNAETDDLKSVTVSGDISLVADTPYSYEAPVSVPDAEVTEYDVKFYLWEKLTLVPLCEVTTVSVAPTPWSGGASESIAKATASDFDGNYEGYYMIKSAEDLAKFATIVNGGETAANAVLCNDIYFNSGNDYSTYQKILGSYTIGGASYSDSAKAYGGIFDGNGKTIYGLYLKGFDGATDVNGLFRFVNGGTIKNLNIERPYLVVRSTTGSSGYYFSPLIGRINGAGATITGVNIIGGLVKTEADKYAPAFGSFAARIYTTINNATVSIKNCTSSITIDNSAGKSYDGINGKYDAGLGAMVGRAQGFYTGTGTITIDGCSFTGHINVPGNSYVGAVIGRGTDGSNYDKVIIKNCSGEFTASANTTFREDDDIIFGCGKNATNGGGNSFTKTVK